MKVLIVAKTRRGTGACVGGITEQGRSVRLVARDAAQNEHAGLEYEVGEVWEVESVPDPEIIPPHVENVIVHRSRRLRRSDRLKETIFRFLPPVAGGPEMLFDGRAQATAPGGLYISERAGLPSRSTMFWVPDRPLQRDCEGKRIRYRYPTSDGGRTLTFVGFQEPPAEIPAGALLRVSLAHWWRPADRPEEELRCFVQLSGWFLDSPGNGQKLAPGKPEAREGAAPAQAEGGEPAPLRRRAAEVLKQTFGFSGFLPLQAEIVDRVLAREDTLVVMPTGGGKSLCYQLPALLFEGLTVVISPLVALMQDQITQLEQVGVPAACLNHLVGLREYQSIMQAVRRGRFKLLYLAPETLLRPETLLLLEQSRLACLAIDEAHCISEWGHDFRPEYRQLAAVRRRFPAAACVALTATATPRVREDIRRQLGLPAGGEFVASFNRPNLFLAVEPRRDALAQVIAFLEKRRGQSGIIYCGTRKRADELCADLAANGWPALAYHAGMPGDERRRNQERFIHDETPLMAATVAFGMGINKSNVRFVIHTHLPKDLESYYQEIGRAGRDGLPADCLLLYNRSDAVLHRRFIDQGAASEKRGREERLGAMLKFAEARECRRRPLLGYFAESAAHHCGHCDNCAQAPAAGPVTDVTEAARKFLSCVQRTGQVFGAAHIVAVLRGSRAERVRSRQHDRLSVFGTGRDLPEKEWQRLAGHFVEVGLLERDVAFGNLRLSARGRKVLDGLETVSVPARNDLSAPPPVTPSRAVVPEGHDANLFEKLRALRKELATQAGVPAYVVFSDRALLEMAAALPQDEARFLAINGVGKVKLDRYGSRFINVIRTHCGQHALAGDATAAPPDPVRLVRPGRNRRSREIGALFNSGQGVEQIARRYGVQPGTVVQHLRRFYECGEELEANRVLAVSRLPEQDKRRVFEIFTRLGADYLGPVHEALSGSISYAELHVLRLYWLCRKPGQAGEAGTTNASGSRCSD